jgi:hypothetical protein
LKGRKKKTKFSPIVRKKIINCIFNAWPEVLPLKNSAKHYAVNLFGWREGPMARSCGNELLGSINGGRLPD